MNDKTTPGPASQTTASTVKETLTSIIIAFVLAFVFRAFVIEPFVIPTGSMAPTLLGQHMRFTGPESGLTWTVNPWYPPNDPNNPKAIQGETRMDPVRGEVVVDPAITANDPITREALQRRNVPRQAGDRILVLKYLYSVYDPKRWDVVVFKSPVETELNLIKRLIGLPGEQVALIDGDVFVRRPPAGEAPAQGTNMWMLPGWTVQRKPERIQRVAWQLLFDSAYTPDPGGPARFRSPWIGTDPGWEIEGRPQYRFAGAGPTALRWDDAARPIIDHYSYNETMRIVPSFPVSDIRARFGVNPDKPGLRIIALLEARRHEFRAILDGAGSATQVTLQMRPAPDAANPDPPWQALGAPAEGPPLRTDRVTMVDFWHSDQSLSVWIDGSRIAAADYDWTPEQRVRAALGVELSRLGPFTPRDPGPFFQADLYARPRFRWEFQGPPFTLTRVSLFRDIHYQAGTYSPGAPRQSRADQPFLTTHPFQTLALSKDQFFVCGDNSPSSLDARAWASPDPWIAQEIDSSIGTVPRDLLIGRAFFVYFPSMLRDPRSRVPMPDFGRLRFIW